MIRKNRENATRNCCNQSLAENKEEKRENQAEGLSVTVSVEDRSGLDMFG